MTTIRSIRSRRLFLVALVGLMAMLFSMSHRVQADEPLDTPPTSAAQDGALHEVPDTLPLETETLLSDTAPLPSEEMLSPYPDLSNPSPDEPGAEAPEAVGTLQFQRQLAGGRVIHSSPTFADVNGDGKQEILIGTTDQHGEYGIGRPVSIGAFDSTTGRPLWETPVNSPVNGSLSVGNLDNRGDLEVVVPVGGSTFNNQHYIGGIYVYNARTGALLWEWFTQDDHPNETGDGYTDGVFATPAIGDVDGDGDMEIAFGAWDRNIYLLDYVGRREAWRYHNADTVWSSAAMADLNQDGDLEIITGADISGPNAGGFLHVFDHHRNTPLFTKYVPGAIYSSPAIGDMDNDGDLEIVVGTHSSTLNPSDPRGQIFAWDHRGNLLPGWPVFTSKSVSISSPALADINGDGDLEIFIGAEDGKLYGLHHNGTNVSGWPAAHTFPYFIWSSPTVADYDGDGQLEVLVAHHFSVYALNSRGVIESEWNSNYTIVGSPAIGDPDQDGKVEIVIGGSHINDATHGYLYAWETGPASGAGFPWPMFQQNAQHTSLYPTPSAAVPFSGPFTVLYEQGSSSQSATFSLQNNGTVPFEWTASASDQRVTIRPASGTLAPGQTTTIRVTISAANLRAGRHQLGEIVISFGGAGGQLDPIRIPIRAAVGDISHLYLPLVRR